MGKFELEYIKSQEFDDVYAYEGMDLGCTYSKVKSVLKVWAPTADRMVCHVEKQSKEESLDMTKEDRGVWSLILEGDYELASYVYLAYFEGEIHEATDPYGVSSTPNHKRTVIVDMEKTCIDNNKAHLTPLESYTDAIIYELHVRDFSVDQQSGMMNKGQFLAFTEKNTVTEALLPSGLDYIESLGITHIQLLPVYDYGSVDELNIKASYNWGYDPVQYNLPEGSYSSDVHNPYARIEELKKAIAAIHHRGLRVIMDVVYNHMFDREGSAFEKLVPHYYFRSDLEGNDSNGSFCGNDLDSTRAMMRQFLLRSTKLWIEEYGFDGFRFDLMGILDIDTMNAIYEQTKSIDASGMIYGEGWNMPTMISDDYKATMMNHEKMPGIGFFNDIFREKIKGGTLEDKFENQGYASSRVENSLEAKHLLYGTVKEVEQDGRNIEKYFNHPEQTVNYVECHDNHTVWDKLSLVLPEESEEIRQLREQFMTKLVLMSQGIPFIHAGQEFYRTKGGDHNSYKSSEEINKIDWSRKDQYSEDIEVIAAYIDFRKQEPLLRLKTEELVRECCFIDVLENHTLVYRLQNQETWIEMYINPTLEDQCFSVKEQLTYRLGRVEIKENEVIVKPLEIAIFKNS